MYNLLKCEFMKLRKSREFTYILSGICVASLVILIQRIYQMEVFIKHMGEEYAIQAVYCFMNMISKPYIVIILGTIFAVLSVCRDFQDRIVQSTALCGYSRIKMILSKAIAIYSAIAVFVAAYVFICPLGVGILYGFGMELNTATIMKMIRMYLLCVITVCAVSSAASVIAYIFKNSALSTVVWFTCLFLYVFCTIGAQGAFGLCQPVDFIVKNSFLMLSGMIELDMYSGDILRIVLVNSAAIISLFLVKCFIFQRTELK